jgi:hypothetical protein
MRMARAEGIPRSPGGALGSSNEHVPAVARFSVWCEVLGTEWLGLSTALAAIGVAAFHFGWKIPGAGQHIDLQVSALLLVLVSLLAGVLEGSQRAIARREQRVQEQHREIERLVRMPQRRVVDAKYQLYRDSFMCTQLVGFLMMARMEASAMTPEMALGIERRWGNEFLERFRRMFGSGRFGDVFSQWIGGKFPPPRDQAMSIYVGLADFLHLLAERITESDLDPEYLHGRDESPSTRSG